CKCHFHCIARGKILEKKRTRQGQRLRSIDVASAPGPPPGYGRLHPAVTRARRAPCESSTTNGRLNRTIVLLVFPGYQGTMPWRSEKVPVGPSSGSSAR